MKIKKTALAIALLAGTIAFAQQRGPRGDRGQYHKDLSVEQIATLKTKKMTLALDLNDKQQKEIFEFNVANVSFMKEKMEERKATKEQGERQRPTSEERYEMENARLDRMIAQQDALKKILTDEQFDQWKELQLKRHAHQVKNRHKEGRRGK